jgi:hypothetical protein
MTHLIQWAIRHNVSHVALAELRQMYGMDKGTDPVNCENSGQSETALQNAVRLEASKRGLRLWRNNVGACKDDTGRVIRYGLINDSAAINKKLKSPDLVGIRPVVVTSEMVGHTIGQFIGRECKKPGWHYTGTDRERAQLACGELISSLGGDWAFIDNAVNMV